MKCLSNFVVANLVFLYVVNPVYADVGAWFTTIEAERKNELWLNAGMYSYHYDNTQNFNNNNIGFGVEYRFSSISSLTVGGFKNSDRYHSNYVGIYWQPVLIGPIQLGLVGGGFNGYASANNGGWFLAVFPAATIESERLGMNLFFIPSVGDKVHGAISLQLKLKILD